MWKSQNSRMRRFAVILLALFPVRATVSFADEAVGVFRVDVFSDETAEIAMPFEPLATNSVSDFLVGDFAGDGGDDSDRLWQVSSCGGGVSQSVFAYGAWIDPADGDASAVRVSAGDALVFRPGPDEPTSLYVFGRVPTAESQTATLAPGWCLLSLGYPTFFGSWPRFPDGADGPFDASGNCLGFPKFRGGRRSGSRTRRTRPSPGRVLVPTTPLSPVRRESPRSPSTPRTGR